jgi:flagellin
MLSLLTNTSAMTALRSLTMIQAELASTEREMSTGLAVSQPSDNPLAWSQVTKMQSDVGALGVALTALSESASTASTMTAAMTASISVMDVLKNDLVSAENPGADLGKIQTDIVAQQTLLQSIATSANFNGQNWLATTGSTVSMVSSYDSTGGVSTIDIDTSHTALFSLTPSGTVAATGILGSAGANYGAASVMTLDITGATSGDIGNMLKDVETALNSMTTAASTIGATSTNLSVQQTFVSNLSDSLTSGVGALIDADMNEVATRLAALQVQEQLAIEALSIANSNATMILKLFGING